MKSTETLLPRHGTMNPACHMIQSQHYKTAETSRHINTGQFQKDETYC